MTASEELSLRYYEVCCMLLQRWRYSTQNNREDMNDACIESGASYDELRSILKHLRAKYMAGFNNAQKQGRFIDDFYGYYTSTKRPRGRPPTAAGGTGNGVKLPSSNIRAQQPSQPASSDMVTGAGDLMVESDSQSSNDGNAPVGGTGRLRMPSARARKATAPYEAPLASTHSRSSSSSSASSTSSSRSRKASKSQPLAKRYRHGSSEMVGYVGPEGNDYDNLQAYQEKAGRNQAEFERIDVGGSTRCRMEGKAGEELEDEDAVVVMLAPTGQHERQSSLFGLVTAVEEASGKTDGNPVAKSRAISPALDDHGLLLLGLKAHPVTFSHAKTSPSTTAGTNSAKSLLETQSKQEATPSERTSCNNSVGSSGETSLTKVPPSSSSLQSALGGKALEGRVSASFHTQPAKTSSIYPGHPLPPQLANMPPRLPYPPVTFQGHASHPQYYHPHHYFHNLSTPYNQQPQQSVAYYNQYPPQKHERKTSEEQPAYCPQPHQQNSSSQADLLHASYSSTMSTHSLPAMSGHAVVDVVGPADTPTALSGTKIGTCKTVGSNRGQGQEHHSRREGTDRTAQHIVGSMVRDMSGAAPAATVSY